MNMITEKELLLINDIIKEIYTAKDMKKLGNQFLLLIRRIIPYKSAVFSILDGIYTVDENNYVSIEETGSAHEYNLKYAEKDFNNAILSFPKSTSYRDSDIVDENEKIKTEFYREWLLANDKKYMGGLVIKKGGKFTACFVLSRNDMNGPLSDRELFILELFIGHLENIIYDLLFQKEQKTCDLQDIKNYEQLSEREKEVIPYIVKGYSNRDLSEALCISESTAKKHVYSILTKLELSSRGELIRLIH